MALIPLVSNFQGDFVLLLVPVDTDSTMDQLAEACAHHSLDRRVERQPGKTLRVRLQGSDLPFDRGATVGQVALTPMACVQVYYE